MTHQQDPSCFTQKTHRNGRHGSRWLNHGRTPCGDHIDRAQPLLMTLWPLSVLTCTDTLKLLGPCYFIYSCAFPLPLSWLGCDQSPVAHFRQQGHFPPNNSVLEDKRTEGLYKAQKQMSFTESTILTHSLQVPLVATDEGVILLFFFFFFQIFRCFFLSLSFSNLLPKEVSWWSYGIGRG